MRKPDFCLCENQVACAVTAQLISAFVFATQIVKYLFVLVRNFKHSSAAAQTGLCRTLSETPKTVAAKMKWMQFMSRQPHSYHIQMVGNLESESTFHIALSHNHNRKHPLCQVPTLHVFFFFF